MKTISSGPLPLQLEDLPLFYCPFIRKNNMVCHARIVQQNLIWGTAPVSPPEIHNVLPLWELSLGLFVSPLACL